MNTLTTSNKDYFKSHLRLYADAISSSRYVKSNVVVLDSLFTTKSSGLTTDVRAHVKIYPPIRSGIVTISESVNLNELIYFPEIPNVPFNVGIGTTNYEFVINNNNTVTVNETSYGIDDFITVGSKILTIKAFGGLLLEGGDTPSYSIGVSTTSINEGEYVDFTINTFNISNGTTLYYNTSGNVTSSDFSDNSLTGSVSVVSTGATTGIATITRTIANDIETEGEESFALTIRTESTTGPIVATSSTITVNDVIPTFTLTESKSYVNEGEEVVFSISGSNIPEGSYYWSIESQTGDISSSDFITESLVGSVYITNNSGSFTITLKSDIVTEGEESFYVNLRKTSTSGDIVATSGIVTINDTSLDVGNSSSGYTFGPVQVNRDNGDPNVASDWYTICSLENVPEGSKIALFIDTSGSMTQSTIQASYDLLLSKLSEKNISIISVTNSQEDWITPFLVDLP